MWHAMRCTAFDGTHTSCTPRQLAQSLRQTERLALQRLIRHICQRHVLRSVISQLRDQHAWLGQPLHFAQSTLSRLPRRCWRRVAAHAAQRRSAAAVCRQILACSNAVDDFGSHIYASSSSSGAGREGAAAGGFGPEEAPDLTLSVKEGYIGFGSPSSPTPYKLGGRSDTQPPQQLVFVDSSGVDRLCYISVQHASQSPRRSRRKSTRELQRTRPR